MTKSSLIENLYKIKTTLTKIQQMGIVISIDDFETAYSSLSYLPALTIDYLKIDKSFIADVLQNHNKASIVESTIALAHTLNMKVIAKGISIEKQLKFPVNVRCDQIQGYLCNPHSLWKN